MTEPVNAGVMLDDSKQSHPDAISEAAPVVEPSSVTETREAHEPEVQETSTKLVSLWKTSIHIQSYPMVKETIDIVLGIPGVQALEDSKNSVLFPVDSYMHTQPMIKPIVETIDNMGELTLNLVDSTAPCLKTATFNTVGEVVMTPFVELEQAKLQALNWTNETVDRHMLAPARRLIHDTRSYYNKHFYDTHGKPLVRGSLDPAMRLVNHTLEEFAKNNLPEPDMPFSTDAKTEVEKTVVLAMDITKRSVPVVISKKVEVMMLPYTYSNHVVKVFKSNVSKHESGWLKPIMVTYASSMELADEAMKTTMKMFTFGKASKELGSESERSAHIEIEGPAIISQPIESTQATTEV